MKTTCNVWFKINKEWLQSEMLSLLLSVKDHEDFNDFDIEGVSRDGDDIKIKIEGGDFRITIKS